MVWPILLRSDYFPKQTCISMRLDPTAKLTFEASGGERPIALYCADAPRLVAGNFEVSLFARLAGCKPQDRWLAEEQAKTSCCGATANESKCCG